VPQENVRDQFLLTLLSTNVLDEELMKRTIALTQVEAFSNGLKMKSWPEFLSIAGVETVLRESVAKLTKKKKKEVASKVKESETTSIPELTAICDSCGSSNAKARCSSCKCFIYCNATCAKRHWTSGHKQECKVTITLILTLTPNILHLTLTLNT
jgi:hypothetical protein